MATKTLKEFLHIIMIMVTATEGEGHHPQLQIQKKQPERK